MNLTNEQWQQFVECGKEMWGQAALICNDIIRTEGKITIDDKRIWDPFLHTWTNEDWLAILAAWEAEYDENPDMFNWCINKEGKKARVNHTVAFNDTVEVLKGYMKKYPRVLDKRDREMDNKRLAWRMIMSMREVWCNLNGLDYASDHRTRPARKNNANQLFDWN
jgi:hypothetical protein